MFLQLLLQACKNNAALALKSDAMTGAPVSFFEPLIIALDPSIEIWAPILSSSGTCMNRLG